MGNEASQTDDDGTEKYGDNSPKYLYRNFGDVDDAFGYEEDVKEGDSLYQASLMKMAFNGTWSIRVPAGRCPCPRTGHFTVRADQFRSLFIGFGKKRNGSYLRDVWALNLDTLTWNRLKLTGDEITPREGLAATMMNEYIVVFGGFADPNYTNELFTINVTTGEVLIAETTGQLPFPQRDAVIGIHKRNLFLWSGNNGEIAIKELQILHFDTMTWEIRPTNADPCIGITLTQINPSVIIAYGGVFNQIIRMDMKRQTVECFDSTGAAPPEYLHHGGLVMADDYLFYLGGQSPEMKWTMVYANYMKRNWWFVFFVQPDGETTSITDGKISSEGIFLLPKFGSFSSTYLENRRQIIAFLGHPHKSPIRSPSYMPS